MVSRDEIEAEGLTTEDVLDVETAQPQTDVQILPEWEKHPEERPGENLRIEGNTLLYERDGFEVAIESHTRRPTGALILDPESIGKRYPRPLDLAPLRSGVWLRRLSRDLRQLRGDRRDTDHSGELPADV